MVGLLAFSPGAARAAHDDRQGARRPRPPSTTPSPSNQTGLTYVNLPASFIAPGQALFASNCSSCHGREANGSTGVAPNLQGLGAGTVDFWVSTGRMPLANASIEPVRKPPRFNRLQTLEIAAWVQSLTPGVGTQVPDRQHRGPPTSRPATPSSPSTARPATPSPVQGTRWPRAPSPRASIWPLRPRWSKPSGRVRATCPTSGPATSPTPRHGTSPPTSPACIQHPANPGGFGLGGIGPVGEGFVGLLLGVGGLMLVCFWIGNRT